MLLPVLMLCCCLGLSGPPYSGLGLTVLGSLVMLGSGQVSMCLFQMRSKILEEFMNDDSVSVMGR